MAVAGMRAPPAAIGPPWLPPPRPLLPTAASLPIQTAKLEAMLAAASQKPLAHPNEGALPTASARWGQDAAAAAYAPASGCVSDASLAPFWGAVGPWTQRIQTLPVGGSYSSGRPPLQALEGSSALEHGGGAPAARQPHSQRLLFASPSDASTATAAGLGLLVDRQLEPAPAACWVPSGPLSNGATGAAWEEDDDEGGAVSLPIVGVELQPDGTIVRVKAEDVAEELRRHPGLAAWQRGWPRSHAPALLGGGGSPPPSPPSPRLGSEDCDEEGAAPPPVPLPPQALLDGGCVGSVGILCGGGPSSGGVFHPGMSRLVSSGGFGAACPTPWGLQAAMQAAAVPQVPLFTCAGAGSGFVSPHTPFH
jgi:hypothetical protein